MSAVLAAFVAVLAALVAVLAALVAALAAFDAAARPGVASSGLRRLTAWLVGRFVTIGRQVGGQRRDRVLDGAEVDRLERSGDRLLHGVGDRREL